MTQNLVLPVQISSGVGMQVIADTTLSVAAPNITFNSIPGTYKHLRLEIQSRGDGAVTVENVKVQFNADTGSNYDSQFLAVANSSVSGGASAAVTSATIGEEPGTLVGQANGAGAFTATISNYAATTFNKTFHSEGATVDSTVANSQTEIFAGSWRSTAAITSIKLFPATSTNFVAGTRATLYGLN